MKTQVNWKNKALSFLLAAIMALGIPIPAMDTAVLAAEPETIAEWNYTAVSAAEAPATGGANMEGALLSNFKNAAPTFSSGSLSIADWVSGEGDKYWQMAFSTKGFKDLAFTAAQRSSGTGPRDFKLMYSLDGSAWTPVTDAEFDTQVNSTSLELRFENFALPADMANKDKVYLRVQLSSNTSSRAGTGNYPAAEAIANGGTSNINSVVVTGTEDDGTITIAEALAKDVGTEVTVKGMGVYCILNASGGNNGVYLQDETAGIDIYRSGNNITNDQIKAAVFEKEVKVSGTIADYNGLMELMVTDVSAIAELNETPEMPEPRLVTVQDVLEKTYPFTLVKLENVELVTKGTGTSSHVNHTIRQDGQTVSFYGPALGDEIAEGSFININRAVSSINSSSTGNKAPQLYANSASAADIVLHQQQVAAVEAVPGSGSVDVGETIRLSTATDGATIKYTLNGGAETNYTEAGITLSTLPATIVAWAEAVDMLDSVESTFRYTEKADLSSLNHYYGQLHAHTGNSDGVGTYEQAYTYADNVQGLDFLAITDHSNYFDSSSNLGDLEDGGGTNNSWANGLKAADEKTTDEFVGIAGYEMTWSNTAYGHINTFNTTGYVSRNNPRYTSMVNGAGLQNYYDDMADYDGSLSQFNHPGTTFGSFTDFAYRTDERDEAINLLEVGNGDGENTQLNSGYWRSDVYYDRALAKGWHVAPTNNQDNHNADWGDSNSHRTIVLADELTREGIYEAISERRVYSSENPSMKLDYTLNGNVMGSILGEQAGELSISIDVENDEANIGTISFVTKNGIVLDSKEVADAKTAEWDFTIPDSNDFYYVKINQPNGDMTLSAPIWVGEPEIALQGISEIALGAGTPMYDKPISLTTTIFNDADDSAFEISSISYTNEAGGTVAEPKGTMSVAKQSSIEDVASITPVYGNNIVTVTVKGAYKGVQKTYSEKVTFNAIDPNSVARVVVDAAHKNNYVGDNYALNLQTLEAAVADLGIVFDWAAEITDEVLEGAAGLIVTTPQNRGGEILSYTAEELAAVKKYADNGGNLLLMARADYGESADGKTHVLMNGILDQFGVTTKINGDELCLETTSTYSFSIPSSAYTANGIMAGLELDQVYRVYSAAGLVPGEKTVRLINGTEGMISFDSAHTGDAVGNAAGADMLVLAQEETANGGIAYIAGSTFCSSFESDQSQYDNFIIARAMLESFLGEDGPKVSTIAEARKGSEGTPFTVIGTVTSQSVVAGVDHAFTDCIYIQDETGGICIHPVVTTDLKVGQKVRITGAVKSYNGDIELGLTNEASEITVIGADVNPLAPKTFTDLSEAVKRENEGWLAKLYGTVTEIAGGDIIIEDESGNTAKIFINGYILNSNTGDTSLNEGVVVGAKISAVGLLSIDTAQGGQRLRVRDRAEIVIDDGSAPANAPTLISMVLGEDAANTAHFGWYSNSAAEDNLDTVESVVMIAEAADVSEDGLFPFAAAEEYKGTPKEASEGKYANRVKADGLAAGTEYVYVVGNGAEINWSDMGSFTTDDGDGEFSFIYASDAQTTQQSHGDVWKANLSEALETVGDPGFVLHTGDQVDVATNEDHYDYFFTPQEEFLSVPLYTASGNHESPGNATSYFTNHFVTPENGAVDANYWYKYGNALIMVLNTESLPDYTASDQIEWMKETAANVEHDWLIIGMHKDIYSVASHFDDKDVAPRRTALIPVFEEIGVDLVLQGHDHSFMRSYVMKGGEKQEVSEEDGYFINPDGIVYMTVGSPGGLKQYTVDRAQQDLLDLFANENMKDGENQFAHIEVNGNELVVSTYDSVTDGDPEVYDTLKIRKTEEDVEPITVSVLFAAGENGKVSAFVGEGEIESGEDNVSLNAKVTFIAEPDKGYIVDTWTVNGEAMLTDPANELTIERIAEDTDVEVSFKEDLGGEEDFTVSFDAELVTAEYEDGSAVNEEGGDMIPYGTKITFTAKAPAEDGTQIVWYVNGVRVEGNNTVTFVYTVTGDAEITINYEELEETSYTVSFSAGSRGSVTAEYGGEELESGDEVAAGSEVFFRAKPDSGYSVSEWRVNGTGSAGSVRSFDLIVTEDTSVTVSFRRDSDEDENDDNSRPNSGTSGNGGTGGGNTNAPVNTITNQVNGGGKSVSITVEEDGSVTLDSGNSAAIIEGGKTVNLSSGANTVKVGSGTLEEAGGKNGEVTIVTKSSELPPSLGLNLAVKDKANTALKEDSTLAIAVGALSSFENALEVSFDTSKVELGGTDPSKLSVVMFDSQGNLTLVDSKYVDGKIVYNAAKPGSYTVAMLGLNHVTMSQDAEVYTVNGVQALMGLTPGVVDERVMVPAKFIVEGLGGTIAWDDSTKTATFTLNGRAVSVAIGEKVAYGAPAAYLSEGRTMVPLKYIAETLGCFVSYNTETRTIDILC